MSLRIEDVKVGDELVCIDLSKLNENLSKHGNFIVTKVESHRIWINDKFTLFKYELGIFKKKDQSQYTFDDLIKTARKAFDDGMLRHLSQSIDPVKELQITTRDGVCIEWTDNLNDYLPSIDFIKSLYKEKFTIESEEDIERVKDGAKVTLTNNETFIAIDGYVDCGLNLVGCDYKGIRFALSLLTLKGATVEQERGCDDRP